MSQDDEISVCNNHSHFTSLPEGNFREFYIDFDNRCLYSIGQVPPIGRMRVSFAVEGFDVGLSFGEPNDEGNVQVTATPQVDADALDACVAHVAALNEKWERVWPAVCEVIMQARKGYRREAAVKPENTKLTFQPPGEHDGDEEEDWSCSLELTAYDGVYFVEFNLDGEVIDSGVSF